MHVSNTYTRSMKDPYGKQTDYILFTYIYIISQRALSYVRTIWDWIQLIAELIVFRRSPMTRVSPESSRSTGKVWDSIATVAQASTFECFLFPCAIEWQGGKRLINCAWKRGSSRRVECRHNSSRARYFWYWIKQRGNITVLYIYIYIGTYKLRIPHTKNNPVHSRMINRQSEPHVWTGKKKKNTDQISGWLHLLNTKWMIACKIQNMRV